MLSLSSSSSYLIYLRDITYNNFSEHWTTHTLHGENKLCHFQQHVFFISCLMYLNSLNIILNRYNIIIIIFLYFIPMIAMSTLYSKVGRELRENNLPVGDGDGDQRRTVRVQERQKVSHLTSFMTKLVTTRYQEKTTEVN